MNVLDSELPAWLDRGYRPELVYGDTGSGKSASTIIRIFQFLLANPNIATIYSPVPIYEGDFRKGPASEPRRLFDNSDGHLLDYPRAKVVVVESWVRFLHDFKMGKIKDAVLFLDEASRIAAARNYNTALNQLFSEVVESAARYNVKVFLTEQRLRNVDIDMRAIITDVYRPTFGVGNVFPTFRNPDSKVELVYKKFDWGQLERWPERRGSDGENYDADEEIVGELRELPVLWKDAWTYYSREIPPNYHSGLTAGEETFSQMLEEGLFEHITSEDHPYSREVSRKKPLSWQALEKIAGFWTNKEFWVLDRNQMQSLVYILMTRYQMFCRSKTTFEYQVGICPNGHERRFRKGIPKGLIQCNEPLCRRIISLDKIETRRSA